MTRSPRGINIIPESDVYRLVMRSKLPSAEAFQDWVVEEVLPALRQHGGYMMPAKPDETEDEILARALIIAQQTITRQKQALAEAAPVIDLYGHMTKGGTFWPFRLVLQKLRISMRELHSICHSAGLLRRMIVCGELRWKPTKSAIKKELIALARYEANQNLYYGFTAKGLELLKTFVQDESK